MPAPALLLLLAVARDAEGWTPLPLLGAAQRTLVETDLACTPESVAVVGIHVPLPGAGSLTRIRFGLRERDPGGGWGPLEESSVPTEFHPTSAFAVGHVFQFLTDPTIASDGGGGFVCAALARVREKATSEPAQYGAILVDRWTRSGGWDGWRELEVQPIPTGGGFPLDKPVVVAGDPGELVVTWWFRENVPTSPKRQGYRRSTDGGASWVGELIRDAEAGDASIEAWFAPQPAPRPAPRSSSGTPWRRARPCTASSSACRVPTGRSSSATSTARTGRRSS